MEVLSDNPLITLSGVIVILVLAGRSLINNQYSITKDLLQSVKDQTATQQELLILFKEQILNSTVDNINRANDQTNIVEQLTRIENKIDNCHEKDTKQ